MNKRQMAMVFSAAIFACVLSISVVVVAYEPETASNTGAQQQPSYTEYPGEIGDIAKRAESQIKEINEVSELEKEKLEAVKREQYFEDNKEETSRNLLSKDDIAAIEKERAQKEKMIRTKVGYEIQSLEAEQTAAQGVLPTAGPRPASQTSSRGMVTGIVFYNNRGAALVAGEIVRENDVVLGVKVLKVTADYVEFEKQGSRWKQAVGELPQTSYWAQPQQSAPAQQPSTVPKAKAKPGR